MKKFILISGLMFCLYLSLTGSGCESNPETIKPPVINHSQAIKFYTEDIGATWEMHEVNHPPFPSESITELCCFSNFDLSTYTIVLDRKYLLKTTNFGDSFFLTYECAQPISDITNAGFNGQGFAVGQDGYILVTSDAGTSWNEIPALRFDDLGQIDFGDELNGIIIPDGLGDSTLRTVNGGNTWTLAPPISIDTKMEAVKFINSVPGTTAFSCGHSGKIFKTTNTGSTWVEVPSPVTEFLVSIDFIEPLGLILCDNGYVLRSTDAGSTWVSTGDNYGSGHRKIYMDASAHWMLTKTHVQKSTDNGLTWRIQTTHDGDSYHDMFFIKNAGFVVGTRLSTAQQ